MSSSTFVPLAGVIIFVLICFKTILYIGAFFGSKPNSPTEESVSIQSPTPIAAVRSAPPQSQPLVPKSTMPLTRTPASVKPAGSQQDFSKTDNLTSIDRINFHEFVTAGEQGAAEDVEAHTYLENGIAAGLQLDLVRPHSLLEKIGLREGDIIKKVDGQEVHNGSSPFEIMRGHPENQNHKVIIRRGEEELTLDVQIQ